MNKSIKYYDANMEYINNIDELIEAKYVFLQLINPKDPRDVILFRQICDEWGAHDNLIIMASIKGNKETLSSYLSNKKANNVIIIEDNSGIIPNLVEASYYENLYLLLDSKGRRLLIKSNLLGYEKQLNIDLVRNINKEIHSLDELIPIGVNVNKIEWMQQLSDILLNYKSDKEYYVAIFGSFCNTCAEGTILSYLNTIARENKAEVIIILSNYSSQNDVDNFKIIFDIKYQVIRSDIRLEERLEMLKKYFYDYELNNVVFKMTKEGIILNRADSQCECYHNILSKMNESN